MPQNSRSSNAVVIHLGDITVSNIFQITGAGQKSHDGIPPVLDLMTVKLEKLKLSRFIIAFQLVEYDTKFI